jgi:hypothetical protein
MTTNSPTNTNQASEDELRAIIERYIDRAAVLAKQDGTSFNNKHLLKLDMATAIETIIRTEKLKLLAEVRELLIDRIPVYDGDDSFGKEYQAGYNSMAHATRTMQLQQSAELAKLEAEL